MFNTGLCSVTFRELTAEQIIELAAKAGLDGIEWGGDIHVPPGEFSRATEVADMTKSAGLKIVSYGSYYRVGCENENSFKQILKTAIELDAPAIRVWAGNRGSKDADETYRAAVASNARRIASLAKNHNIKVNFEYHGGTLTDTKESALHLMNETDHDNLGLYWQPAVGLEANSRIESIETLNRWLTHVHTFHWKETSRLPLVKGKREWSCYLRRLAETSDNRYLLLEFVKKNDQQQFLQDAEILKDLAEKNQHRE